MLFLDIYRFLKLFI